MKKLHILCFILVMLCTCQIPVHAQEKSLNKLKRSSNVACPWVPRISAREAYTKFKAGKAIILHAGGEKYERRHIMGAINVVDPNDPNAGDSSKVRIRKFPRRGIEIFTYCY